MKKGFAPAAALVLLLVVAGLGLAVTRVTDLKNVFQKPKASGGEFNCVVTGPEKVASGTAATYTLSGITGANKAQLWYIPTSAKDNQGLWRQIGSDCQNSGCTQNIQGCPCRLVGNSVGFKVIWV